VDNFLGYVESGFYDGLIFHRVMPNFMIQTGSYDANLNPRMPDANIPGEYDNGLLNERGTLAMALVPDANNQPIRDSATSGFYINLVHNTSLDGDYTVFGSVIDGMDVVDRIANLPTEDVAGGALANVPRPFGPVIIYKAGIFGDFDGDYDVDLIDYGIFANQWLDEGSGDTLKVTASDAAAGDWFGYAVAVDANFIIVGAPKDNQKGAAYIFEYSDGSWTQQAKLTASDGQINDYFGSSVSISRNHVIIGALGDDEFTGSAYVFDCNDGIWTQRAKLLAYEGQAGDWFGRSVSISGDCAIVGADLYDVPRADNPDILVRDCGAVFVYLRNEDGTNKWGYYAGLSPEARAVNDFFGYSVSINGETILVGATGDDPCSNFPNGAGSAYVCAYDVNRGWFERAKLAADDGAESDNFGWSVSTDGHYAIVGAPLNDDGGDKSGSAYIFKFEPNESDPNNWDQVTKLTASDAAAGDWFGYSVAIGHGQALVGAYQNDDNGSNSGSVYIFEPNEIDPNNWEQVAKLTAPDAAAGDYFGASVAVAGVGRHAVIGAYGNDDGGSQSGSAYILQLCPDVDIDGDCAVTFDDLADFTDNWLSH
jgi:cyclophilin family peptidyl-prolyl cis-trans isomerase